MRTLVRNVLGLVLDWRHTNNIKPQVPSQVRAPCSRGKRETRSASRLPFVFCRLSRQMRLIALFSIIACNDGASGTLELPVLDTEFAMYGTAAEGRSIAASSVRVARTTDLETLAPDPIGGGNVDMVFAGLDPADFPIDLSPDALTFVSDDDELARPLPNIHSPHVFEEPVPPDQPATLVPVDQPSVPQEFLVDREDRLERMLSGFAIQNPCRQPVQEFSVYTPRIPAEAILVMRTMSSGETIVGFSATSTAIIGVLGPSDQDPELIGVTTSTSTPVLDGEVAKIYDLGDTEVSARGRVLPGELTLNIEGGFGSVGGVAFWSDARDRWVDDTPPLAEAFPRALYGVRHATVDGVPSICTFGGLQGSDRAAAIWCRDATGGEWTLRGRFTRKFGVRAVEEESGVLLAFDISGAVYEHAGGDSWNPIFSSALNSGCDPLCANFSAFARTREKDFFGVMAGTKAQVLLLERGGTSLVAVEPEIVPQALFADERADAELAKRFISAAVDPDGATWLGTETPDLFRISPDRTKVERICLPEDLEGTQIVSIEPHPNGRLILGLAPAIFAFTDWRL
jgi:hypothetical protein